VIFRLTSVAAVASGVVVAFPQLPWPAVMKILIIQLLALLGIFSLSPFYYPAIINSANAQE